MKKNIFFLFLALLFISWCGSSPSQDLSQKFSITTGDNTSWDLDVSPESHNDLASSWENFDANRPFPDDSQENTESPRPPFWYIAFTREDLLLALENEKHVILHFFDAESIVDQSFQIDVNNNAYEIPSSVVIFFTEYDENNILVQRYWINQENTFISLDENLTEESRISKWIVSLKTIVSYFNL